MDYEEFSKSIDKTIKERNGIIDLYKQLIAAKENTINYKNIAIDSLNKEIGLLNSEIKEEKEKKNELYDKYINLKTLNDFNTKKYEEKISELELENKFLTEKSKELSKLLADFLSKKELNKNIEHIEWFQLEQKPEKEKTYLVRYLWANSYSIGFAGYNYICGFPTESDCVITHWAEVKGPKL